MAQPEESAIHVPSDEAKTPGPSETAQPVLQLEPGQIQSVTVESLQRVAIGDPKIADLTIVSASEVLIQAKATGKTNLIVWDRHGQRTWQLVVASRTVEAEEAQLRQLITELNMPGLSISRKENKLFVVGEVDRQEDLDRLEQLLSAFSGIVNLVRVTAKPSQPREAPKLVKLAVQVLEISRSDLERLGVKWGDTISFTEPAVSDLTGFQALTGRFGTSLSRTSYTVALNALLQQNKARVIAEPKLVTTSGKEASSFVGVDVPIASSSSTTGTGGTTVSTGVEFRQTGVTLRMTPTVQDDGRGGYRITTVVSAELTDIDNSVAITIQSGSSTIPVPGFKVKKTSTEVTLAPGESVAIAGLFEAKDSLTSNQVPALGTIPFLGRLFRSPETQSSQRELVIVITPELVGEEQAAFTRNRTVEQALTKQETAESVSAPRAGPSIPTTTAMSSPRAAATESGDPARHYAQLIQGRIAEALRYPEFERQQGVGGQVVLRLHLFRNGTLEQAMVSQSSGIESLDHEAVNAAQTQAPYPAFPAEVGQQDLWLDLPVLFQP